MPRKSFQITFANGKSKHVTRDERDSLLLGQEIQFLKGNEYKYIAKPHTVHGLAQLGVVFDRMMKRARQEPDHYPGTFVFELHDKRQREGMESSEGLALRLHIPSGPCCKFNPIYAMQESQRRLRA